MKKNIRFKFNLHFQWPFSYILIWPFTTSKMSFLFSTNDWVDVNAFFTMGKGMMNGLVPYRDLFEQKGPFLYLIYGLGSLIHSKGFMGIFLIEIAAMATNLVFCFKIFNLYFSKTTSKVLTIFFPLLIMNFEFFREGGSAEELCIPFLLILLYEVLSRIVKDPSSLLFSKKGLVWQGFTVAFIFLTKFTLLGPWIAFYLFIGISYLVHKEYKELLQMVGYSLVGFLIGIIPWAVYFALNDALFTFLETYILINSSSYNSSSLAIFERIFFVILNVASDMKRSYSNLFLVFPGIVFVAFLKAISKKTRYRFFVLVLGISCLFFIFVGMQFHKYYILFFLPFGIFGYILIGKIFENLKKMKFEIFDFKAAVLLPFCFALSIILSVSINKNIEESLLFPTNASISTNKEEPLMCAQDMFAEYMLSKTSQPTLLNYLFLDGGFYLAADILPSEKHFELQNLDHASYPDNYYGQYDAVKEGKVDFVVTEIYSEEITEERIEVMGLADHYELALKHSQKRQDSYVTYLLFEKVQ